MTITKPLTCMLQGIALSIMLTATLTGEYVLSPEQITTLEASKQALPDTVRRELTRKCRLAMAKNGGRLDINQLSGAQLKKRAYHNEKSDTKVVEIHLCGKCYILK